MSAAAIEPAFRTRSGRRVAIRPIRPDDKAALEAAFEHLGAETRYRRFLRPDQDGFFEAGMQIHRARHFGLVTRQAPLLKPGIEYLDFNPAALSHGLFPVFWV